MYTIAIDFLLVVEVLVSLLIVLLVLMQRPKSEGLGASMASATMNELFSSQTTNVLQKATRVLGGTFFIVALVLSMLYSWSARSDTKSIIQRKLSSAPMPVSASPTPGADGKNLPLPKTNDAASPADVSGTSASPAHAKPGDSPASTDLNAPSLKLGTTPQPATGGTSTGLQLQTGSSAPDKKIGF